MKRSGPTQPSRTFVRLALAASVGVLLATAQGRADDPVYWMEAAATASEVTVSLYETNPGAGSAFVDDMIGAGPFSRMLSGFANEKIVQALPLATPQLTRAAGAPGTLSAAAAWALTADPEQSSAVYYAVSRYHDVGTAERVDAVRDPRIARHLRVAPVRLRARLVEHLVPDWGWERGVKPTVLRMSNRAEMDRVFGRDGTVLSFFKSGYTGQIGLIEFFAPSVGLDTIRTTLSARSGMAGASILRVHATGRYLAYSEFFRAPKGTARRRLAETPVATEVEGGRAGMVVENYFSR